MCDPSSDMSVAIYGCSVTLLHFRNLLSSLLSLLVSHKNSDHLHLWFCLSVRTIKPKRLKLESANLAHWLSITISCPPINIRSRSKGHRVKKCKSRDGIYYFVIKHINRAAPFHYCTAGTSYCYYYYINITCWPTAQTDTIIGSNALVVYGTSFIFLLSTVCR